MLKINLFRSLFAFILALTLSACSDLDNSIPPAELSEIKPSLKLTVNWSQALGGGSDLYHKLSPVIVADSIYTASASGFVSKVNLETGEVIWQVASGHKMYAGLAATKDVIVLANSDGLLSVRKNSASLDEIWQFHVKSEINVQPVIDQNNVYVRLSNGQLIAFDLTTGKKNWTVTRRVPALSITGSALPVISEQSLLSGFDNGTLVSFDKNSGDTAWEKTISVPTGRSELDRMVDLDGTLVIKNGVIFSSTFQGRLAAIQLQDGNELWSRPMSSIKQISADDDAVYITDNDSYLWSIDRRTGAALWKQDLLHHRQLTAMSISNDAVIVADFEGFAHWLDKQTGQVIARISISDTKVLNPPLLHKDQTSQQVVFLDSFNSLTSISVDALK